VNPRAGLDDVEKRKFLTVPGLELPPLGLPARSQSLYRLSYPGSYMIVIYSSLPLLVKICILIYCRYAIITKILNQFNACNVVNFNTSCGVQASYTHRYSIFMVQINMF
jgi:hypothetical protein